MNVTYSNFISIHFPSQTPLPEQEAATEGLDIDIEVLSTKELAFHMTLFDWDLFWAVHEYELLYHTFGRHHFGKVSLSPHIKSHDIFVINPTALGVDSSWGINHMGENCGNVSTYYWKETPKIICEKTLLSVST